MAETKQQAYDPSRSQSNPDTLASFLRSQITGVLTEVPGIGPATATKMKAEGIETTYALIGKYLMLKGAEVESVEHCDRFFHCKNYYCYACKALK